MEVEENYRKAEELYKKAATLFSLSEYWLNEAKRESSKMKEMAEKAVKNIGELRGYHGR